MQRPIRRSNYDQSLKNIIRLCRVNSTIANNEMVINKTPNNINQLSEIITIDDSTIYICGQTALINPNIFTVTDVNAVLSIGPTNVLPENHQDYLENYMCIDLNDNIFNQTTEEISKGLEFIKQNVAKRNNIVIHCSTGISRAPTVCAIYLMKKLHISAVEAMQIISDARPCVMPKKWLIRRILLIECGIKSIPLRSFYSTRSDGVLVSHH